MIFVFRTRAHTHTHTHTYTHRSFDSDCELCHLWFNPCPIGWFLFR